MEEQSRREFAPARATAGAQDAALQEPQVCAEFLSVHTALYNTFNVQRYLISAKTHRALRAVAMNKWREAVTAA